MGRFTRVVAVDVPHHLTQRVNGRRFILDCDADRAVYRNLLRENIALYGVSLIGDCLMSNHVHLVAVPRKPDGLAQALKQDTDAMLRTATPLTNRAGVCGKDAIIPVRWMNRIFGKPCGTRSSILCGPDWSQGWSCGPGREQPATAGRERTMSR
jgi:REP element-mobilizing transposase RayT